MIMIYRGVKGISNFNKIALFNQLDIKKCKKKWPKVSENKSQIGLKWVKYP